MCVALQELTSAYKSFWMLLDRQSASSCRKGFSYLCRNQSRWWKRWIIRQTCLFILLIFYPANSLLATTTCVTAIIHWCLFVRPGFVTFCPRLCLICVSPFVDVPFLFSSTFCFSLQDVSELRNELQRKEMLVQKHLTKLHHWQQVLEDVSSQHRKPSDFPPPGPLAFLEQASASLPPAPLKPN